MLRTYLVIHYSGSTLGQLMVNLDGPDPSQIFIISAIAIALAAAPVYFSISPTPESYESETFPYRNSKGFHLLGLWTSLQQDWHSAG